MAIKIKSQKDYLLTEANIELPTDLNALDSLMRAMRASGRIVAQYSEGGLLGVNLEQKTKIRETVSTKVRELVGVDTTEINGQ